MNPFDATGDTTGHEKIPSAPPHGSGKDEMNLAEFPFASLRNRGDSRKAIVYEGWTEDRDGNRHQQRWIVRGDSLLGLPNEFDERVYVALMKITKESGFADRKVPFSIYRVLRIMGLSTAQKDYQNVEDSLDRLVGVTFKSEEAFWDNSEKQRITTSKAFHLIDEYWLRYKEKDNRVKEEEGVAAYVVWGDRIWKSIQANYIKSLDLDYFYSLESPVARRLYRFLDKRMQYQEHYEIDIFDLAGRLGMVRYQFPAKVLEKLQPALDELIARGFLLRAEPVKFKGYTRIRFVRAAQPVLLPSPARADEAPALAEPEDDPPSVAPGSQQELEQQLVALKIGREKARSLVAHYSPDYITAKVELLQWTRETRRAGRPITDPAAWLIRAIEKDYRPPDGFRTRAEREQEAAEQRRQQEARERQQAEQEKRTQDEATERQAHLQQEYGTTDRERLLWVRALGDIECSTTRAVFQARFSRTQLLSIQGGVALIGVPNPASREWLESRLARMIRDALRALGEEVSQIRCVVMDAGR